jgi:hypothetical protein
MVLTHWFKGRSQDNWVSEVESYDHSSVPDGCRDFCLHWCIQNGSRADLSDWYQCLYPSSKASAV